jgi:hypothetical protein
MAQSTHSHYKREEQVNSKEGLDQSKTKTQQGKWWMCSAMPSIWGMWCCDVHSNGLGQPYSWDICSLHGLFLGLDHLLPAAFLVDVPCSWHLWLPGVSNATLASPSQLHTLLSQGMSAGTLTLLHCLTYQALLWNLGGSLHNTANLGFYMPVKPASCGDKVCQQLEH